MTETTLVCDTPSMLTMPDPPCALVLRTDFSNDATWAAVCAASSALSVEGFGATLSFVSDRAFADLSVEQVVALPRVADRGFLFLVDHVTITNPEMPLVVLDLNVEPGRWFRVVPAEMWGVENNLTLANLDFRDFADRVDPDGVFRGFAG
ncbi:hypothetical protein GCM10027280_60830 [Micromonospora polyrhachis]|uniref:DUF6924 domain-containing protein n=1 Tax=Micromonospora polyrhachis TaxID=1282883 RepID=A0A7W7SU06_9ACTN|nr:hypothetical protein [Micromonospora polyrhachis]MBB4960967.1 hypothetical protein [Micromonospora polyrhachis]